MSLHKKKKHYAFVCCILLTLMQIGVEQKKQDSEGLCTFCGLPFLVETHLARFDS